MLALSDLRKFAKVELWDKEELMHSDYFKALGPEPLEKSFTLANFKKAIKIKKGKIKQVLMDQSVIAGIGNIYSDEILWSAKIHPLRLIEDLEDKDFKRMYLAMKKILKIAIKDRGESISDYRTPAGEKGRFDRHRMVYRREKEPCPRCKEPIKRLKIGGRSAHYCPKCQRISKIQ